MLNKVIFRKPKFKKIKEENFCAIDMHVHSEYSDSRTKVKNLLKKANKKGFGIAIADHNEIRGSLKALEQKEVVVIPAIEITSLNGIHLLAYFYNKGEMKEFYEKHVEKYKMKNPHSRINRKLNDILNDALEYNCITSLAHPFGYLWANMKKTIKTKTGTSILKKVTAIEVINGEVSRLRNLKALEWAIRRDKAYTAGSDEHTLIELGSVLTMSKNHSVEGFLNSIKKKQNIVVGKEKNMINRILYHSLGADKHFRHLPSNLKNAYSHTYKKKLKDLKDKTKEKIIKIKNIKNNLKQ